MPSTGSLAERVAISPSSHGTLSSSCVVCARSSGMPNTVNPAGGRCVCHSASMAAIFIFWFSLARYPDSSPSTTTDSEQASPKLAATVIERRAICTCQPRSM
jgi:hypothetical protein